MMHRQNPVLRSPNSSFVGRLARRWATLHGERGSSLVEYALVFLLLMTMLLGIAEFSRALYAYHFASNAAREAARYASVRGSTCSNDGSCSAVNSASGTPGPTTPADIQAFVQNVPLGIDPTQVTSAAAWPVLANSPTICNTTANAPGCTVQVQVTYVFNFIFPFVSSSPLTMSSTSQMTISH